MRLRISRGSGCHDRRPIRLGTARGGAGLPPPARHAARGDVAADRGGAPGAARARARAAALAALGPRRRRRARDRRGPGPRQHAAPADHRRRARRSRLPGGGGAVPEPHRSSAHGLPLRNAHRADRLSVCRPGARSAHDHAADARFAGGGGPEAQEPARGSGTRVGPDRPGPPGQRPRRPPVDQPRIGTTQRAAAAAHGEPRRARPRARARSTVMQGVQLLLAAVVAIQRPALPPEIGLALAQAQAAFTAVAPAVDALDGLDALDQLDALDGLDALDALDGDHPVAVQDDQDPTDSLWLAARRAFNRGDYGNAASLYADLTRRNPNSARAGDALYWAAFALYKNADLTRARSLLVEQQRRYPKAATLRDGDALLARIQTALAKQGDEEAGRWLAE